MGQLMQGRYSAKHIFELCGTFWPETHTSAHEYVLNLSRLNELGVEQARKVAQASGISLTEFDILVTLRRTEKPHALTPAMLQKSLLITSGGLTKLLYQLEARQLISRSVQLHDKRSKLAHLTKKGRELAETSMHNMLTMEEDVLASALNKQEREQIIKLLAKVTQTLEEKALQTTPVET